ncbi:MAG: pseudouridine synthase [Acholeplasmataceae bacterium]
MSIRINKFLSESGVCSRRMADQYIRDGRVKINGLVASLGAKVTLDDQVHLDDVIVSHKPKHVYLAFNKPKGVTSTTDQSIPGNMIDFINYPERIFHIGRLDKDSEGLILLTNHGDIVNQILRAENNHEKEYVVTVNKNITQSFLNAMASGIEILDTITQPCILRKVSNKTFHIILTQGLNRQIRRMCQALDYEVTDLKRIRVMHIKLDIPLGTYRHLTDQEIETLQTMIRL